MSQAEFERILDRIVAQLRIEAQKNPVSDSKEFENRVRKVLENAIGAGSVDFDPAAQAFPTSP
jgi:hypothetical protein